MLRKLFGLREKVEKRMDRPAWFSFTRFIDNIHYVSGEQVTEIQRHTQLRENSVSFVLTSSPDSASELKDYQKIAVKALRNIDLGEELYV